MTKFVNHFSDCIYMSIVQETDCLLRIIPVMQLSLHNVRLKKPFHVYMGNNVDKKSH